jgi:magnesium-transporting ATPase (P-type)
MSADSGNTSDNMTKTEETTKGSIIFAYVVLSFVILAIVGVVIYGFVSGAIENLNNIYLTKDANFKPSTGSLIVGIVTLAGSLLFLGIGIWYYYAHKREFREEFENNFNEGKGNNPIYHTVKKQLQVKNINIFLIMLTISFFLLFLGVSTFLNQKDSFSMYQAYQRECPQNTINAEDQKHPDGLL